MKIVYIILLTFLLSVTTFAQDLPIPKSLSVAKLEANIAGNKINTVNDFLNGTPIIEPIENDPQNSVGTFVWRGDSQTKNVLVQSPLFPFMMVRRQMTRIGTTMSGTRP